MKVVIATLAALGVCAGTSAWADATTSPGTNSLHISTIGVAIPFSSIATPVVVLSGSIRKGRARRVLVVDATFGSLAPGENAYVKPQVNGIDLEPTDDLGNGNGAGCNCPATATVGCSATGTWWLDLDAAEAAHPGTFVGKQIDVQLLGVTNQFAGVAVVAAMNARLEKK